MNKIIEEANALGISLVGWVWLERGPYLYRLLNNGGRLLIDVRNDGYTIHGTGWPRDGALNDCINHANNWAEAHGGWAPAPIGYGLSEWQPIETAPKDEQVVLYHVPGQRKPFMCRADDYWSGLAAYLDGATHWMPLPAPPEVKG